MIKDYYFEDFIGVFETDYDTQPMIDYFEMLLETNKVMNNSFFI